MLTKLPIVTVIPAVPAIEGRAASLVCEPLLPPETGGGSVVAPPPPPANTYIYVPANPAVYTGVETRTQVSVVPAGYVCEIGTYFLPDPTFPGGLVPVIENRCYWEYP